MERALDNAEAAARIQGAVVGGDNLPDVDSDLRTFAGISQSFGRLDREARKPVDGPFEAEEEELGPAEAE